MAPSCSGSRRSSVVSRKCVYTERRSRNRIVLVVVLVLDWVSGLDYDYDYEDEDEDDEEKFARRAKILRDHAKSSP